MRSVLTIAGFTVSVLVVMLFAQAQNARWMKSENPTLMIKGSTRVEWIDRMLGVMFAVTLTEVIVCSFYLLVFGADW